MKKFIMTRKALREFADLVVNDALPVKSNPTSKEATKAGCEGSVNVSERPRSKDQLKQSIDALIKDVPDEEVSDTYDALQNALTAKDKGTTMKKNATGKLTAEGKLRAAIRQSLMEISPRFDISYTGAGDDIYAMGHADDEADDDKPIKRGYELMSDTGGAEFDEIAKELGFNNASGAKKAVETALEKMQFFMTRGEEGESERQELVLKGMADYIKMLQSSGELTPDDVSVLKDNPEIVQELDGFREFMRNYVNRAMRAAGKGE